MSQYSRTSPPLLGRFHVGASSMAMNERPMNGFIAQAMEELAPPNYRLQAEQHGRARQGTTSPDIVVHMPYGLRTIIETEYRNPAIGDAKRRLGYEFNDYILPIKSVLAVGIPQNLGNLGFTELSQALRNGQPQFLMQVVTGTSEDDPDVQITPSSPVNVSLQDLVQYAWLAAIPESYAETVVKQVVSNLRATQTELTGRLSTAGESAQAGLIERYGNHDNANRMESVAGNVVGTLASMIQLHMNLDQWGNLDGILNIGNPDLWQKVAPYHGIPSRIAIEWRKIEAVDYMPLSTIAAGMVEDSDLGPKLGATLKAVHDTLTEYVSAGISATTNVVAEIWQALIPDRDQRAAYYTKPPVAELLANMTTARLAEPAAAKYNEVCAGTGTLARAVEENIRFRHFANTTDKASIHARRMEECVQLTDINPQSISVATANLSSLEPETAFGNSAIFAITSPGGSLNFLPKEGVANMEEQLVGRSGAQGEMLVIDPRTVGICCNNDPYFRPRGGAKNPVSRKEMQRYSRQADRRVKDIAHGQAGLATFMHVIEHEMLGYGSPHGKVLPLTAAHGSSYTGFRQNIENEYCNVIAICTAAGDGKSMSADTNVQEMLLVGSKHRPPSGITTGYHGDKAVTCINLTKTFSNKLEAKMFADAIRQEVSKGDPKGEIKVGDTVGTYFRMTGLGAGIPWSSLGSTGEYSILTEHITHGRAWNPATNSHQTFGLPMTTLGDIAKRGTGDDLIGKIAGSTSPRGAFVIHENEHGNLTKHNNPSMWEVDSETQLSITCTPTHYGTPRDEKKAAKIRETAGHFHFSRSLQLSAHKIATCYTEEPCIGGRSWTTIFANNGVSQAITLFLNSTYGLITRIGHGMFGGQLGRTTMGVSGINPHPIPNFASDCEAGNQARNIAVDNFERLRKLEFQRISWSVLDENRMELDRVVTLMLGIPWNQETERMLDSWRRLMCQQAVVHGNTDEVLAKLAEAGIIA